MPPALTIAAPATPELPRVDAPFGAFAPNVPQAALIRLVRKSFLRRGLFRGTMARAAAMLRAGPLDVTFRGARFRVHLDETSSEWALVFHEQYNGQELDFLAGALPPGAVFVDIGANVGLYSLALAPLVGPTGTVIAIEPDRRALARLAVNRAASCAGNVVVFPVAAGPRDGEIGFARRPNSGASHISAEAADRVRVRPLLDILGEAGSDRIDALKIDVEGYEDRVLLPFFRNAPRQAWPVRIVLEDEYAASWSEPCLPFLAALGYRTAGRTRNNVLMVLSGPGARARAGRLSVVAANS